jgi:hypothetical protein
LSYKKEGIYPNIYKARLIFPYPLFIIGIFSMAGSGTIRKTYEDLLSDLESSMLNFLLDGEKVIYFWQGIYLMNKWEEYTRKKPDDLAREYLEPEGERVRGTLVLTNMRIIWHQVKNNMDIDLRKLEGIKRFGDRVCIEVMDVFKDYEYRLTYPKVATKEEFEVFRNVILAWKQAAQKSGDQR